MIASKDGDIDCTFGRQPREREQLASPLVQRAFELAREGDRAAASFLYARYGDDVYECVRGAVADHVRACEAMRCVFAFGKAGEWASPQLASPRTCLLDGARRLAYQVAANPNVPLSA